MTTEKTNALEATRAYLSGLAESTADSGPAKPIHCALVKAEEQGLTDIDGLLECLRAYVFAGNPDGEYEVSHSYWLGIRAWRRYLEKEHGIVCPWDRLPGRVEKVERDRVRLDERPLSDVFNLVMPQARQVPAGECIYALSFMMIRSTAIPMIAEFNDRTNSLEFIDRPSLAMNSHELPMLQKIFGGGGPIYALQRLADRGDGLDPTRAYQRLNDMLQSQARSWMGDNYIPPHHIQKIAMISHLQMYGWGDGHEQVCARREISPKQLQRTLAKWCMPNKKGQRAISEETMAMIFGSSNPD